MEGGIRVSGRAAAILNSAGLNRFLSLRVYSVYRNEADGYDYVPVFFDRRG